MFKRYIEEEIARELFDEYLNARHKQYFEMHLLAPFDQLYPAEVLKISDCRTYECIFEDWLRERELHYQITDHKDLDW